MKLGLSCTAAAALVSSAGTFAASHRHISRTKPKYHEAVSTVCRMCRAGCGITAYIDRNRLITLMGDSQHPGNRGKVCAKGLSALNLFYNAERITQPLRRKGLRGSGGWEPINWDRAIHEIRERLIASKSNGAKLIWDGAGGNVVHSVQEIQSHFAMFFDADKLESQNRLILETKICGAPIIPDFENSRLILMIGANPFESGPRYIQDAMRIVNSTSNGAKLITFDPRNSVTAGASDLWLPVKPGTDVAVLLAICNLLVATGRTKKPAGPKLMAHLAKFSASYAAEQAGIQENDIKAIAGLFADIQPASILIGDSLCESNNGEDVYRAAMLLEDLTGSLGEKGGLIPVNMPVQEKGLTNADRIAFYQEMIKQKLSSALIINRANPVYEMAGMNLKDAIKDETRTPLYVHISPFFNESATYADYFLPEATFLECWDLVRIQSNSSLSEFTVQKPVIVPQGQSKPAWDIVRDLLGQELGISYGEAEAVSHLASNFGVTEKNKYLLHGAADSIKLSPSILKLSKGGDIISPAFEPGLSLQKGDGQLYYITFESNVVGKYSIYSKWLLEICHQAPIIIHPKTAALLKIKDGDKVIVSADGGSIQGIALLLEGIRPDTTAIHRDLGHTNSGILALSKNNEKSSDPDMAYIWWENESDQANAFIPLRSNNNAGQVLYSNIVRIKKA